jgi:glycosyltransferase involved in cell wall biosynthesis
MNYPKITIITPNFNQEQYLERTILSVIEQGYPNLEYIVMDGGSTDNSVNIIKKHEKYITYWESAKDGGMYYALNKGFERSSGEIMGWINSDDFLHPKSLFLIAKIFSDLPNISWIQGLPNIANKEDNIVYVKPYRQYSILDFLSGLNSQNWIQQESTFWKRNLYKLAGNKIETKYKLAGDFELWMRFFKYEQLYSVNSILGTYRITDKNAGVLNIKEYMKEANETLNTIIINKKTKFKIIFTKRLKLLKHFGNYQYLPFVKTLFEYPDEVVYDLKIDRFILKKYGIF